jgi:release factor glutamine methyltransferase
VSASIADALREAATRLRAAGREAPGSSGFASPDTDAEELLSRLLGVTRAGLRARRVRALDAADAARFERWLSRRLAGEPVQYITGWAAFRSLDLEVDPHVLVPRPETEGLVEHVLQVLRAEAARWPLPRVLDLGTGSGAIALAIATEYPAATVTATDASAEAVAVAQRNAARLAAGDRVRFLAGSWFDALGADDRFEVVVSNPPYIAESEREALPIDVRDHEPAQALFSGATGLEALTEIIGEAPRHLVAGGLLALELAEARAREVMAWLEGAGEWEGAELHNDLAGQPRVLLARRARGPAIAPAQWPEERPE